MAHTMTERLSVIRTASPSEQAYQILHFGFAALPIIAGLDKFAHALVNWNAYLSPVIPRTTGISAHNFMLGVGVIEILAGLMVAVKPRIGAWVVGLWLCGLIVNLLSIPGFFDIALRDL